VSSDLKVLYKCIIIIIIIIIITRSTPEFKIIRLFCAKYEEDPEIGLELVLYTVLVFLHFQVISGFLHYFDKTVGPTY